MDTENKRRSVTGIYGLRTVPPVPGTAQSGTQRRHVASLYAMEPRAGSTTFWIPVTLTGETGFKQDADASQTWVQDADGSSTWKPVYKVDE